MNEFDKIGQDMPYTESDDYLDNLISSATENAIEKNRSKGTIAKWTIASLAAASVAVLVVVGVKLFNDQPAQPVVAHENVSPIDEFLDGLNDDDAQLLAYYEVEDVPEY
ncbi:MAG: hypothetical protein J5784_04035 [Muribaculaceae bacterium]|nr:hypothetical protein [Muribaculaceae bacterium]